jgi:hypothetical protein
MVERTKQQSARLPAPLRLFAILIIVLTMLSWAFAYFCWLRGMPYPYSWPYYGHAFGTDFSSFQDRFQYFHSIQFFQFKGPVFLYAAPLAVCYHILFAAWGNRSSALPAFEIFGICVACVAALVFYRALRQHGTTAKNATLFCLISVLFSYPLYFDLQRGNVEIIVWTFTLAAFWAFRSDRQGISAILIGFAIALKWYPVVLLGLFFYPRRYRYIAIAIFTAVGVTIFSDLWLGPTIKIAFQETLQGAQTFIQLYALHYGDVGYDHSFFSVFKLLIYPLRPDLAANLNRYVLLAAVSATALYFLRIRKLPVINQISILLILSITLPPVSFDYTLLHLYICWGIFVIYLIDAQRAGYSVPFGRLIMGLYAFALAPHGYVIFAERRFCGQLRWIGLAALLYIFLKQPFPEVQSAAPLTASKLQLTPTLEGSNR